MKELARVKTCQWCGKEFTPPPNPRASEWAKRFCSLECAVVATIAAANWVREGGVEDKEMKKVKGGE